jgi:hypothetical protein
VHAGRRVSAVRDRSRAHEARLAWLAIALSTSAIILTVVYLVGDFVMTTLTHVFAR